MSELPAASACKALAGPTPTRGPVKGIAAIFERHQCAGAIQPSEQLFPHRRSQDLSRERLIAISMSPWSDGEDLRPGMSTSGRKHLWTFNRGHPERLGKGLEGGALQGVSRAEPQRRRC